MEEHDEICLTNDQEARVIDRALKQSERIVDSIAKGDGEWRKWTRPAWEMLPGLYALAEQVRLEESRHDC